MSDERIRAAVPDGDRLIDEVVGFGCLLGDGVDGVLRNVAFSAGQGGSYLTVTTTQVLPDAC